MDPIMKPDIKTTILSLKVGDSVVFSGKHTNASTVRKAIQRLPKEYEARIFKVSEVAIVGGILVLRSDDKTQNN